MLCVNEARRRGTPSKWNKKQLVVFLSIGLVDGSAAAGNVYFTNGSFSGYTNGTVLRFLAGGEEGNGAIGNVGKAMV